MKVGYVFAGLLLMVVFAAAGAVWRPFRYRAVLFSATPAFQILWFGLVGDHPNKLLLALPLILVPIVVIAVLLWASARTE